MTSVAEQAPHEDNGHKSADERSSCNRSTYPEGEELHILGLDADGQSCSERETGETRAGINDSRRIISRQEQGYTHRGLTGNSSGTDRARIQGATESPMFTLNLHDVTASDLTLEYHRDSLDDFLQRAIQRNKRAMEDHIDQGGYRSSCWQIASELRGHPLFAGYRGSEAAMFLDKHIDWDDLPDYDIFGGGGIDPKDEFIDSWNYQDRHEIPPLSTPVPPEAVLTFAERYPLTHPNAKPAYAKTVSICFWYAYLLQENNWFFLSAGKLAQMLDCCKRSANLYLRRAVSERLIKTHKVYEAKARQATEYLWIGDVNYRGGDDA